MNYSQSKRKFNEIKLNEVEKIKKNDNKTLKNLVSHGGIKFNVTNIMTKRMLMTASLFGAFRL